MSTVLESPDELQSGPGFIDRAYFDIDQTKVESDHADDVIGEVGLDAGRLFRPGHPQCAVRFQPVAQSRKSLLQLRNFADEQHHEIERTSGYGLDPVGHRPERVA